MFKGYSVALPLTYNKQDGPFMLNKSMIDVVKQNLKTLVLTDQGERLMIPDFGVGLKKFLFENINQTTKIQIESEVKTQVGKYMPYVEIRRVDVLEDPNMTNKLVVVISFFVPALNVNDTLVLGG
jgi:hypothetical protein